MEERARYGAGAVGDSTGFLIAEGADGDFDDDDCRDTERVRKARLGLNRLRLGL